jgi:polysaccharide export outer membrane protein
MRVTRSFLLLLTVALGAAGCARQPLPPVQMAAAPALAPRAVLAAPSIDSTVYGPVVAPVAVAAPVPAAGRGFMLAAPAPRVALVAAPASSLAYAPQIGEKPYTLDSGDRLRIVVFGQDGLSNSYLVDASGYIAMPLIGSVLARGATSDQLSSRIAEKLRQGFIREPHVAVEVEAYRPFFILGEVTQPGQYPYVADMTVETAVAIAGGFAPRAFRKTVTITRLINGQQVRLTVPTTFPLRPGDTVNVKERWF